MQLRVSPRQTRELDSMARMLHPERVEQALLRGANPNGRWIHNRIHGIQSPFTAAYKVTPTIARRAIPFLTPNAVISGNNGLRILIDLVAAGVKHEPYQAGTVEAIKEYLEVSAQDSLAKIKR